MAYQISFEKLSVGLGESIDAIYHSTTWQDMWLKIDLFGIDFDLDAFMLLCDTLCYYYGFWNHTRPRFAAFKHLLRLKRDNPVAKIKLKKKTLDAVTTEVESLERHLLLNPHMATPGKKCELRAWKSIQHILEKCQA